jgi:hypothetical protein
MTTTNENARPLGRADRALNSNVSGIHAETLPHTATWGVSSDGLPFPRPGTCKAALLACLLTDDEATHRSFDGVAGTMRAAVYVRRLRMDGWPIVTELVAGSNRFERVRFAEYRLADSVTIGEPERVFVAAAELAAMGVL